MGTAATTERRTPPVVVGHRGAPAHRPEHTLASYELAIAMGADYIEPDLVSTQDHRLVVRHENEISATTDVAEHPELAARRTTKSIDGVAVSGWFTEDFTLAELQVLRATERLPELRPQSAAFDGLFAIPTFQQVVDLARRSGVGIYPETKHPTYFRSIGLPLEEPLVAALARNGLDRRDAAVFVQSFEVASLRRLRGMLRDLRLVQLLDSAGAPADLVAAGDPRTYADLATPDGLAGIARYADGLGPSKDLILPRAGDQSLRGPTSLVRDAHRAGLVVHPFTFRPENAFLPLDLRRGAPGSAAYARTHGDAPAELELFLRQGIDGLFADDPGMAVAAREALARGRPA